MRRWSDSSGQYTCRRLERIAKHFKVKMSVPGANLTKKVRDPILTAGARIDRHGTTTASAKSRTTKSARRRDPNLDADGRRTDSSWVREELERFQRAAQVPGDLATAPVSRTRTRPSRCGLKISQTTEFSIGDAVNEMVVSAGAEASRPSRREDRSRIMKESKERLGSSTIVGLSYMTTKPHSGTCRGGESQASASPPRSALRPDRRAHVWTNSRSACPCATTNGC